MQELPVFVINLDRRTDRWASITAELVKANVSAIRISAIDGREMMAQDVPTPYLSPSEYACMLSHCKAMRRFLDTDASAALILEDDAQLATDIVTVLGSVEWWPPGVCLMNLHHNASLPRYLGRECGQTPSGRIVRPISHKYLGAVGYLINREAAFTVLKDCSRIAPMPIDVMLFNLVYSRTARRLKPVQVAPSMIRHKGAILASDLKFDRRSTQHRGRIHFYHLFRKLPELPNRFWVLFLWCCGLVKRELTQYSAVPPSTRDCAVCRTVRRTSESAQN